MHSKLMMDLPPGRKYPWEEWFSNKITVLVRGEDYDCSQSTMIQMIRNKASQVGLKLKVVDTDTEIVIVVMGRREESEISHTDQTPVTCEYVKHDVAAPERNKGQSAQSNQQGDGQS